MSDTERVPAPIRVTFDGVEFEVTTLDDAAILLGIITRHVEALEADVAKLRDDTNELAGRFNMHVEGSAGSAPDDY